MVMAENESKPYGPCAFMVGAAVGCLGTLMLVAIDRHFRSAGEPSPAPIAAVAAPAPKPESQIIDAEPIRARLAMLGLETRSAIRPSFVAQGYCPTEATGADVMVMAENSDVAVIYLCVFSSGSFTVVW